MARRSGWPIFDNRRSNEPSSGSAGLEAGTDQPGVCRQPSASAGEVRREAVREAVAGGRLLALVAGHGLRLPVKYRPVSAIAVEVMGRVTRRSVAARLMSRRYGGVLDAGGGVDLSRPG